MNADEFACLCEVCGASCAGACHDVKDPIRCACCFTMCECPRPKSHLGRNILKFWYTIAIISISVIVIACASVIHRDLDVRDGDLNFLLDNWRNNAIIDLQILTDTTTPCPE